MPDTEFTALAVRIGNDIYTVFGKLSFQARKRCGRWFIDRSDK